MCLKSTRLKLIKTRLTNPDLFSSRFTFGRNFIIARLISTYCLLMLMIFMHKKKLK